MNVWQWGKMGADCQQDGWASNWARGRVGASLPRVQQDVIRSEVLKSGI